MEKNPAYRQLNRVVVMHTDSETGKTFIIGATRPGYPVDFSAEDIDFLREKAEGLGKGFTLSFAHHDEKGWIYNQLDTYKRPLLVYKKKKPIEAPYQPHGRGTPAFDDESQVRALIASGHLYITTLDELLSRHASTRRCDLTGMEPLR